MRLRSLRVTIRRVQARQARAKGRGRKAWRGYVEQLEGRIALASAVGNLAMSGATALSPQSVSAQYQVTGADLSGPMTLGIYRSPTPTFGPSSLIVGQATIQGSDLTVGPHQMTVNLSNALDINPSEKYVLAVADPGGQVAESSKADNVTSFRTWIVGGVTHGLELDGQFPSWVTSIASGLKADGYDAAIAFNWAQLSAVPAPGSVPAAAQLMAAQISQVIAALPIQANDVVDVHLVGHSRGGDVVSLAAGLLDRSKPPLSGGFLELTLLDPHPARNGPVAYESYSNGPIGTLAQMDLSAFQAAANDPPLTIPAGVDRTQIFFQQTPVRDALSPDERILIPWGEVPAAGATSGVAYHNLTGLVPTHEGMPYAYLSMIVPGLATDAPVPIPPSAVPAPPRSGGPAFASSRLGMNYENKFARSAGVSAPVARLLLGDYSRLDSLLVHRQLPRARAQIKQMVRFIGGRGGRGIPAAESPYLVGLLQETSALLLR
jgi:pimeloyl-ACP methyl ester carboxylesterase